MPAQQQAVDVSCNAMIIQQQEIILTRRKLLLTRAREFRHYLDPLIMFGISLLIFFILVKGYIKKEGYYNSPYFLIFLIFPTIALLFYYNQRYLLRLKQIETEFSKDDNYKIVKETLQSLG